MAEDKSFIKDLLLEDYKYLCDSFWKNEETGEKRVQFLITLVTAVMAALATLLSTSIKDGNADNVISRIEIIIPIILFSLLSLLMIGIITLLRILKRNEVTDGYKYEMDEIRQRFKDYFDKDLGILYNYNPFIKKSIIRLPIRKLGGLAHTVAVINSIIISSFAAIIMLNDSNQLTKNAIFITIITFIFSFIIQFFYIWIRDDRYKNYLEMTKYTHAGGIVYRIENDEIKYLIITAKKKSADWVLPKGHIEYKKDKSLMETAKREVKEETGIKADVLKPVGSIKFLMDEEIVNTKFFLMKYSKETKKRKSENRQQEWFLFNEALDRLTFPDTKKLIKAANKIIKRLPKDKFR
jgi:8-oxo-dGTP pyrophosphatase MutT (NUDIX family)